MSFSAFEFEIWPKLVQDGADLVCPLDDWEDGSRKLCGNIRMTEKDHIPPDPTHASPKVRKRILSQQRNLWEEPHLLNQDDQGRMQDLPVVGSQRSFTATQHRHLSNKIEENTCNNIAIGGSSPEHSDDAKNSFQTDEILFLNMMAEDISRKPVRLKCAADVVHSDHNSGNGQNTTSERCTYNSRTSGNQKCCNKKQLRSSVDDSTQRRLPFDAQP